MSKKTRVTGDVTGKFSITFNPTKGDQYFIVYEEKRFPKNREKKGLPPVTIDYIRSIDQSCEQQADMLVQLFEKGDSTIKQILGRFITKVVKQSLIDVTNAQLYHETSLYDALHNGNISKESNNLSSK